MATATLRRFVVDDAIGAVSSLVLRPRGARAVLVVAHGAGAGMTHPFLEDLCQALARQRVATFRFQFPYTEAGRRAPDRAPRLKATVAAALVEARRATRSLPVYAGGKSMGGRMSSMLLAERGDLDAAGLVFFGFPLHAPGKPGSERAAHLSDVGVPMLFLQGTRDRLADLGRLRPVIRELGERATLHVIEGGDHSFVVPKRSGRSRDDVLEELAATTAAWIERH
jgi:predicted alpha/beta-hydrolase family hydrolase